MNQTETANKEPIANLHPTLFIDFPEAAQQQMNWLPETPTKASSPSELCVFPTIVTAGTEAEASSSDQATPGQVKPQAQRLVETKSNADGKKNRKVVAASAARASPVAAIAPTCKVRILPPGQNTIKKIGQITLDETHKGKFRDDSAKANENARMDRSWTTSTSSSLPPV